MTTSIRDAYAALPGPLRRELAAGTIGLEQLARLAALAPDLTGPETAFSLAHAAWQSAPLHGPGAAAFLARAPKDHPLRPAAHLVNKFWREPANQSYLARLIERREEDKLNAYLLSRIQAEPDDLFLRDQTAYAAAFALDPELLAIALADLPEPLLPLTNLIRAEFHLLTNDPKAARDLCLSALAAAPDLSAALPLLARAYLTLGKDDLALRAAVSAIKARPWDTSTILWAADLANRQDRAVRPLPGATAILLYTFDKARNLDPTLAALFASHLGRATVTVLDNGSSDQTPKILAAWRDRVPGRLTTLRLPVNIGAPAARNWLLSLPETREAHQSVFLDDDALVPKDWLGKLGAALAQYPDAGVIGARVHDLGAPHVTQHADGHLIPDNNPAAPYRVANPQAHIPTTGQFAYLRPCATVTGCCHLLPTNKLHPKSEFPIGFSPSQFDDLERDLRMVEEGGYAVYQGHLPIAHAKSSGKAQSKQALGNRAKLTALHPPEKLTPALNTLSQLLDQDIQSKAQTLDCL